MVDPDGLDSEDYNGDNFGRDEDGDIGYVGIGEGTKHDIGNGTDGNWTEISDGVYQSNTKSYNPISGEYEYSILGLEDSNNKENDDKTQVVDGLNHLDKIDDTPPDKKDNDVSRWDNDIEGSGDDSNIFDKFRDSNKKLKEEIKPYQDKFNEEIDSSLIFKNTPVISSIEKGIRYTIKFETGGSPYDQMLEDNGVIVLTGVPPALGIKGGIPGLSKFYKFGGGGKLQAYNPRNGQYVKVPGLIKGVNKVSESTIGQFIIGFGQGYVKSIASGLDVPSITRAQKAGQILGEFTGTIIDILKN